MADHPILFMPGPVEVDAELREIMSTPLVGHRSAVFKESVRAVCELLPPVLCTTQHAYFENAPATALMEAGIRNLVRPGGKVLHLTCGAFGERWVKISKACGRAPETAAVEWGQPTTPELLRSVLTPEFDAVCVTHSETSTGVLNPIAEIAATVREFAPETMVLVDAVSSLAGAELRFDDWGIDLAFAGTQKCLALPPGLCAFALSQRAVERAAAMEGRGYLLDFAAMPERFEKAAPPATPCVPLVFALQRQLERIRNEGIEARWRRHVALRDQTISWAADHGFEPFVDALWRSPTVTTLRGSGRDLDSLVENARAAGFTIGKGYGKLSTETIRVGHMGDHTAERLARLLDALAR